MRHLVAAVMVVAPAAASGQGLVFESEQTASLDARFRVLDERAARQYSGSEPETVTRTASRAPAAYLGAYQGPFLALAKAAARRHGIPEDLFARLVQRESAWNADAVSHKGAQGLAQLMPDTAALMGVDAADPEQNLDGGARYLARQYQRFGSWRLALAAYNAGPEVVARHGDVPPYEETENYVEAILGR